MNEYDDDWDDGDDDFDDWTSGIDLDDPEDFDPDARYEDFLPPAWHDYPVDPDEKSERAKAEHDRKVREQASKILLQCFGNLDSNLELTIDELELIRRVDSGSGGTILSEDDRSTAFDLVIKLKSPIYWISDGFLFGYSNAKFPF